jgi:hypothetical protein
METNGEAIGKLFLGDAIGVRWTDEVLFCILPDVNRPPTVWDRHRRTLHRFQALYSGSVDSICTFQSPSDVLGRRRFGV